MKCFLVSDKVHRRTRRHAFKGRWWRVLLASVALLLTQLTTWVSAGEIFPDYSKTRVRFASGGDELHGTLVLPADQHGPFPVLIFVHGDGAMPYDAYGYYNPIWDALAAHGIASFSWDKPGVGASEGNWLMQDMDDRAAEVVAAHRSLSQSSEVSSESIGLIGFSQAGWVLPRLADQPWVNYMVFISTAINWIEQGEYMTRKRLAAAGKTSRAEEQEALARDQKFNEFLLGKQADYSAYLTFVERYGDRDERDDPMSRDRFEFAVKNVAEDATSRLGGIDVPVLALFGTDDLNVDVENTVAVYRRVFDGNDQVDFKHHVFRGATHQLTKAGYFNKPVPGLFDVLLMNVLGDELFAPGVLESIGAFVAGHSFPWNARPRSGAR